MPRPTNRKSEALRSFLLELSQLTEKYGFEIHGRPDFEGWTDAPEIRGNGVSLDLLYDESRREYDAV